jgi:hypothetical protein
MREGPMGQLCIHIPPFASDYTGVCSTLFDFDCLTAINDANCCTGNYVFYDEPRWSSSAKTTFSTVLRNIDAVFGHDSKVIDQVCAAAGDLESEMIAVVGTPVPAIVGMDMQGIAREVEARIGRPTFGFDTNGFSYYDKGIALAAKALFDRYADIHAIAKPNSINLLGLTPLDLGALDNATDLRNLLSDGGLTVNGSYFMSTSLAEVRRVGEAEVNLAVTAAGVRVAKYLLRRFGTPYVSACPMGQEHALAVLNRLHGISREPAALRGLTEPALLLIMDQVVGVSFRQALRLIGYPRKVCVASFFGWEEELALAGDFHLPDEKSLINLARSGRYCAWVGDPFYALIPELDALPHVELVHPAVSGKPQWGGVQSYLSPAFDSLIERVRGL